jgi:hypothetical protein
MASRCHPDCCPAGARSRGCHDHSERRHDQATPCVRSSVCPCMSVVLAWRARLVPELELELSSAPPNSLHAAGALRAALAFIERAVPRASARERRHDGGHVCMWSTRAGGERARTPTEGSADGVEFDDATAPTAEESSPKKPPDTQEEDWTTKRTHNVRNNILRLYGASGPPFPSPSSAPSAFSCDGTNFEFRSRRGCWRAHPGRETGWKGRSIRVRPGGTFLSGGGAAPPLRASAAVRAPRLVVLAVGWASCEGGERARWERTRSMRRQRVCSRMGLTCSLLHCCVDRSSTPPVLVASPRHVLVRVGAHRPRRRHRSAGHRRIRMQGECAGLAGQGEESHHHRRELGRQCRRTTMRRANACQASRRAHDFLFCVVSPSR